MNPFTVLREKKKKKEEEKEGKEKEKKGGRGKEMGHFIAKFQWGLFAQTTLPLCSEEPPGHTLPWQSHSTSLSELEDTFLTD